MISIIIPAHKEEDVIDKAIDAIEAGVKTPHEILVVDDGSTDKTAHIVKMKQIEHSNISLVSHFRNRGLGEALMTGFVNAKYDYVVTIDADLTHDVRLIDKMYELASEDGYDLVIGSRYVKDGGMVNVSLKRVMISQFANWFYRTFFKTTIGDCTSGFKLYKKDLVLNLPLKASGFVIQLEILTNIVKMGNAVTYIEVPYILRDREIGVSKFSFARMLPRYSWEVFKLWIRRYGK